MRIKYSCRTSPTTREAEPYSCMCSDKLSNLFTASVVLFNRIGIKTRHSFSKLVKWQTQEIANMLFSILVICECVFPDGVKYILQSYKCGSTRFCVYHQFLLQFPVSQFFFQRVSAQNRSLILVTVTCVMRLQNVLCYYRVVWSITVVNNGSAETAI